ncbi:alpha/beta hydrolase [Isoptericola aurantiacus]|uniref:alpha/beta hydrolase n=1 Tax=Isoptericola aurantiacus TaxID=3377839 RepID=UPI00383BAD75
MVPTAVRTTFRTLSAAAPPLAVGLGARTFTRVGPPARVRSIDAETHGAARCATVEVDGDSVVTSSWGAAPQSGAPAVLLVHGWQLRASRFGFLVRALVEAGWRVESYDAPAHGDSTGDRLTVLEHMAAMRAVEAAHGPFTAVVGHSLGAFSAATALHDGFAADRFVSLAAPTGFDSVVASFMRLAGISPRLHDRLCDRIARTGFPDETDLRDRFDLCRHPVPARVSTLFVQDLDDTMHSADEARALHAAHPGSELLITSGLGHNRIMDDETVVKTVVDHLGPARS